MGLDSLIVCVRELAIVQVAVELATCHELGVRTVLDDRTLVHNQDEVGVTDRGEPVRDHEAGTALHQAAHRLLDERLGAAVDRTRRRIVRYTRTDGPPKGAMRVDRETLAAEITTAMRAHDKARLSILRLVKNELDIREKESGQPPEPADVVTALKKVLKQTAETLEGSIKVGTDAERTAHLTEQVALLEAYLPAQVTGEALAKIVARVVTGAGITEKRDMGRAIGLVVSECGGNCDKAEVARLVGAALS